MYSISFRTPKINTMSHKHKKHCYGSYNAWTPLHPSVPPSLSSVIQGPPGRDGIQGVKGDQGEPGTKLSVGPTFPANNLSHVGDVYISDAGVVYRFDGVDWTIEYTLPSRTNVMNSQFVFTDDTQVNSYMGLSTINVDFSNVSVPIDSDGAITKFSAKVILGTILDMNVSVQLQLWSGTGAGVVITTLSVPVAAGSTVGTNTVALTTAAKAFDGVSVQYLGVVNDSKQPVSSSTTKGVSVATSVSYQTA